MQEVGTPRAEGPRARPEGDGAGRGGVDQAAERAGEFGRLRDRPERDFDPCKRVGRGGVRRLEGQRARSEDGRADFEREFARRVVLQLQEDVAGALTLTSEDLSGRDEGGRGRDGRRKVVLEKDLPLLNGLESLREAEFFRSAESFEFGVREEEDARVRQDGELSFAFDEVLDILLELLPIQPFKLGAELSVAKKTRSAGALRFPRSGARTSAGVFPFVETSH